MKILSNKEYQDLLRLKEAYFYMYEIASRMDPSVRNAYWDSYLEHDQVHKLNQKYSAGFKQPEDLNKRITENRDNVLLFRKR